MASEDTPLLEVLSLHKTFPGGRGGTPVHAVQDISLRVRAGECLAVVGESGSGKSTLARCLLRLIQPDSGEVRHRGQDLLALPEKEMRARRRHLQMVFQDPYASLHPRHSVERIISAPWRVHRDLVPRSDRAGRVRQLLERVGLPADFAPLSPAQLSGGQRQRVAIARALAMGPDVLLLDEPVSALDVSIQAQVIRLLMTLQEESGLGYLFISHDLALVRLVAGRVMVMRHGEVVEEGPTEQVYADPQHEYTRTLLRSSLAL